MCLSNYQIRIRIPIAFGTEEICIGKKPNTVLIHFFSRKKNLLSINKIVSTFKRCKTRNQKMI